MCLQVTDPRRRTRHVRKATKRIPVFKVFVFNRQFDDKALVLYHLHRGDRFFARRGEDVTLRPLMKLDADTLESHARDYNDVGAGAIHAYRISKGNKIAHPSIVASHCFVYKLTTPLNDHNNVALRIALKGYIPKGAYYILGDAGDIAATSMVMQTKNVYKLVAP